MLKARQGSPDGIVVNTYACGETVDMPDELARVFIRQYKTRKVTKPTAKDRGQASENKSIAKKKP